ncbi:MAG: hypothetical protein QOD26_1044 [Betaproteobacteria bacterium]|jgi:hypothetical protein|nr:hypothetical protein [Betaproteobacteria bacterium]
MDLDRQLALRYLADRGIILPPAGPAIGWGEHLCQSSDSEESLLALVLPWFRQGLENDERCIWQVGGGLGVPAARRALGALIEYSADQVDIVEAGTVIDWLREEARALGQGYRGLRIGGERLHANGALGSRTKALCLCAAEHDSC